MNGKRKTQRIVEGEFGCVVKGAVISYILTVMLAATMGALVLRETLPEQGGKYGAMLIGIISVTGGCAIAIGRRKEKRLILGMCLGVAYLLLLAGTNALLFDGRYERVGEMVLGVIGSCVLFGVMFKQRNHTVKRRRR